MKSVNIIFFLFFFINLSVYASVQVGCRSGNNIYTVDSGTSYNNGGTLIPVYTEASAIKFVYTGDNTTCGIPSTIATSYPIAPGYGAYTSSKCSHSANLGDISSLVYYDTNDYINCPLDDYVWFLIFPIGAFGFYLIRKRSFQLVL